MATGTLTAKDEFRNTTDGWIGAVAFGKHGEHSGIAVEPGGTVWLTEDEQILTANAPRADEDNPFLPRPFQRRDPQTGDVLEEGVRPQLELVRKGVQARNRRPFGAQATPVEETGATVADGEPAAEGESAAGEEVATPDAVPRRRRR